VIRDIVFALSVGFLVGTYSSIYVAAFRSRVDGTAESFRKADKQRGP